MSTKKKDFTQCVFDKCVFNADPGFELCWKHREPVRFVKPGFMRWSNPLSDSPSTPYEVNEFYERMLEKKGEKEELEEFPVHGYQKQKNISEQFKHDFVEFVKSSDWMEQFEKTMKTNGQFYILIPFPQHIKDYVTNALSSNEMTAIARKTRLFGRFTINVTKYGIGVLLTGQRA